MTHTLILKVKTFQLSGAKHFGTVEEKPPGVDPTPPPIPFRVKSSTHGYSVLSSTKIKNFQEKKTKGTPPTMIAQHAQ